MKLLIHCVMIVPAIALFASCQTTERHVYTDPLLRPLERYAGAEPNPGFIAPAHDVQKNPLSKNGKPVQIFLSSKFIELTSKRYEKHGTYTDPQFQRNIRELSQTKGADLMSAPSVVTKPGQQAKVEVIREMILKGDAFDEVLNLGVTLDVKPAVLKNGKIHLSGKATVREIDTPEVRFGDRNTAVAVQSSETYFDTTVKPGHTVRLICRDKDSPGQRIVFVTAQLIEADGAPAKLERSVN